MRTVPRQWLRAVLARKWRDAALPILLMSVNIRTVGVPTHALTVGMIHDVFEHLIIAVIIGGIGLLLRVMVITFAARAQSQPRNARRTT